ncbi:YjbH domain-containing protein [Pseudoalteromonas shioyasakiensis]|uniref:YjbH domain-containing protein n=1 Tax=Pseudoalteromonas shioyasakiensis TaxID=1190813 RepID=UPI0022B209F4|nr:YjbH domain-containing protein [Pseudoalteromonas shioyasakiensis]MCZ4253778.1 YjbH domain-containing protein [Pseudoalteromonas shioyasakiensis]
MSKLNVFLGSAIVLSSPLVFAEQINSNQSLVGYTGLINTPNAEVQGKGTIDLSYNNALFDNLHTYKDGHNFIVSAGLFDGFEVSGQIASSTMHDNLFKPGVRSKQIRDLSFNAKYQIPYIPKDLFSLAIGGKDIGGHVNFYQTYYVVASKELWDFRFSAGIAKSKRPHGEMDGVFGGIEYQVFDWFSLQAEHDAEAFNAGAKVTIPKKWLYDIGELTFTSRFYSDTDYSEEDTYWGVSFSMPLSSEDKQNYKKVEAAPYVAPIATKPTAKIDDHGIGFIQTAMAPELAEQAKALTVTSVKQAPTETTQKLANSSLNSQVIELKEVLINDGFENVVVGYNLNTVFVNFENSVFNRNDIDAIGVVLGRIAESVTNESIHFNVQLSKTDIPLIAIQGKVDNYRLFIEQGVSPDLNVQQGKASIPEGVVWAGKAEASPNFKPRLTLSPATSNTYATDFGVLDYSVGLRAELDVPLWQGGGIKVTGQTILDESSDFEDNGAFDNYSLDEGIVNAMLHQTFALPYGFYNQTQIGFYKDYFDYKAIINETAWLSPEGRHKVSAKIAYFDYADYRASREYETLTYQYNWVEQDITLHATAGKYFYGDSGVKLESRFWFGDSYIAVFYENTDAQKAGVGLSIPLTPRKDMKVTPFGQLKGRDIWRVGLSTQIGEFNRLVFNQGYAPSTQVSLDNTMFKRGRLTSSYIYSNLARMKEAYESYK